MLIKTIVIILFAISARAFLIRPLSAGTLASLQALFGSQNWTTLLISKDSSFADKLVRACVSVLASLNHSSEIATFVSLDRDYVTKLKNICKNTEKCSLVSPLRKSGSVVLQRRTVIMA